MSDAVHRMGPAELGALVAKGPLNEATAIKVLRNPYCSSELALEVAENHRPVLTSHVVRELLCSVRDFPFARALNFLATLPWMSLLQLAQNPRTTPPLRHQAETRVLNRIPTLSPGERVALARRSTRPLFKPLIKLSEPRVLEALLDNPRLVENDVLLMLNTALVTAELCRSVNRHQRWGSAYSVRKALVHCSATPLPVALAVLVGLRPSDIAAVSRHPQLSEPVKAAATSLVERKQNKKQKVLRYSDGGP